MKSPSIQIRNLFTPIQPTVRQVGDHVLYNEYNPSPTLRPYIYCYWVLKTQQQLDSAFTYRVVADGCIDIFWEAKAPSKSFIMGFCEKYTEFELDDNFEFIGIRFLPTIFPQLFKIDAQELSNRFIELEIINQELNQYIRHTTLQSKTLQDLFNQLDSYFINKLNVSDIEADLRFYNALAIILKKNGMVQIEKDLNTGLSPRQLRRKFKYYLGTSAKTFGKVVRFQNILRAKPSTQSLRKNKLFFDVGYYDQAHFIKEFKNFYGVSPSKAFGR